MASFRANQRQNCGQVGVQPQLRKSCDYCVRMKRGCDGKTPCDLCTRRNKQCFRSFKKRSGPAKGAKYGKRRSRLGTKAPRSSPGAATTGAAAAAAAAAVASAPSLCHNFSSNLSSGIAGRPVREREAVRGDKHRAGMRPLPSSTPVPARHAYGEPSATPPQVSVTISPEQTTRYNLTSTPSAVAQLVSPKYAEEAETEPVEEASSAGALEGTQLRCKHTRLETTSELTGGLAGDGWNRRSLIPEVGLNNAKPQPLFYPAEGVAVTVSSTAPSDVRKSTAPGAGSLFVLSDADEYNASAEVLDSKRASLEEVLLGSCSKKASYNAWPQAHGSASSRAPEYIQFSNPAPTHSLRGGIGNWMSGALPERSVSFHERVSPDAGESSPTPSLGELLLEKWPSMAF